MLSINDRSLRANDGTRIAYAVEGSGPALLLTNGLTTTTTFWKYLRPTWLRSHTVVTWDLPGHGNSGPAQSAENTTVEAQPALVAQVMRAAGITKAVQIGWSTGTQVVLEMYRQYPESCEGLGLLLGGAGHALATTRLPLPGTAIDWLMCHLPRPLFDASFHTLAHAFRRPSALDVGRWFGLIGPHVSPADMQELTAHIASVHPATLQRLAHSFQRHSAHDVLASLRVPTLIVGGDRDSFAPTELVAVELQRAAPASLFVRLAEGTHTALLEQPLPIAQAVQRLLACVVASVAAIS